MAPSRIMDTIKMTAITRMTTYNYEGSYYKSQRTTAGGRDYRDDKYYGTKQHQRKEQEV